MLSVTPRNPNSTGFQAQLRISQLSGNRPYWKNAVKDFSHLTARYPDYIVYLNDKNNQITVRNIDKVTKKTISSDVFEKEDGIQSLVFLGVRGAVKTVKAVLKKVVNEKKIESYAVQPVITANGKNMETSAQMINNLNEINQTLKMNCIKRLENPLRVCS